MKHLSIISFFVTTIVFIGTQYTYSEAETPSAINATIAHYERELKNNPDNCELIFALANLLPYQDKLEQAVTLYKKVANSTTPYAAQALYNTAHVLKDLGRQDPVQMQEAIETYKKVIALEPNNAFAYLGLSQCYLASGDFAQGWPLFAWRSKDIQMFAGNIEILQRMYAQKNDLSNVKILIRTEWGAGDNFQFIRFAQLLKKRGATIIMQAYRELKPVLSLCPYLDTVITIGDAFPPHNLQIPLLSLPLVVGNTLETIPRTIPYLYADQKLIEKWHTFFKEDTNFKIGICWCGTGNNNPPPSLNKNIPLKTLMPLLNLEHVSVYSLQKVDGLEELGQLDTLAKTTNIHVFSKQFDETHGRFMDTAAVMKHLDVIITIDTSIAHLAGALGVPVWLMLPYRTDWRWMQNTQSSPWYPTMHLFRQSEPGNWHHVVTDIVNKLT